MGGWVVGRRRVCVCMRTYGGMCSWMGGDAGVLDVSGVPGRVDGHHEDIKHVSGQVGGWMHGWVTGRFYMGRWVGA